MLHIHRAERADRLIEALGGLLAEPPLDPFTPDVIAVPTRGMERWLAQRLSTRLGVSPERGDGVCANVEFPFPRRLIADAIAAGSGIAVDQNPWLPERAVWPLLEVVDGCLDESWLQVLASHLSGPPGASDDPRSRRYSSVRHLAELFDRYAFHRPEMVRAWANGDDTDASGQSLPADVVWQAELWRRLRERIAQPGPAEQVDDACSQLLSSPDLVDLPERLSLFGFTRLPAGHLQVLHALAAGRDVHVFLLHPSPGLWTTVSEALAKTTPTQRRIEDDTAALAENHLLASWGHDAREMQLVLAGSGDYAEHHDAVEQQATTLLAQIQADIRANRAPAGAPVPGGEDLRPELAQGDVSIQIHSCHGRARQVEVLRDAILHLLDDDPTLEPRDVIVMCPDIETFAPLIHATFGAGSGPIDDDLEPVPAEATAPDLRVRLADRALRQTNPILGVIAELIDLTGQRLSASQLLGLADREPVRRRFRFDDADLARIQDWIAQSGIRWGFDADHRTDFKLDAVSAGTWQAGLDRILLGITMTEDGQRLFNRVLPLDDVDSGAIDLAGRLAEFVDRTRAVIDDFNEPKSIDAWAEAIASAADSLTATAPQDSWQGAELERLLSDVVGEATVADAVAPSLLAVPEVRALLAARLEGRPTRANFRTGNLTVCTLVPMRSVPHRVVCLVGLDDGVFPRKAPRDGDDLMLRDPHLGDRDPRTEDRQMLLDALLAASDRLVVTYTGNDERTNAPFPPAVPVGELLDVINATVRTDDGPASRHVLIRHPLQPFDPRNFVSGGLARGRVWSFDSVARDGGRALAGPRSAPERFLSERLAPDERPIIEIEDLVRFVQHPVRAFLRQRLGISLGDYSTEVEDDLIVELDALGKWGVGDRLLHAMLQGVDGRTAVLAEIARGTLPAGVLGQPIIEQVFPVAERIVDEVDQVVDPSTESDPVDVRVAAPDGLQLGGTVSGVRGDVLLSATYSRVAATHRLAAWVRLLALTAADPARPFEAVTVGRPSQGTVRIARLRALADNEADRRDIALDHLGRVLDLYRRGMREPLPLYCKTSAAYAAAAIAGRSPIKPAREEWQSTWKYPNEDQDVEHQFVLGGIRALDDLLEESPRPDEDGAGWATGESNRLGRLALRLWDGLLTFEEVTEL